MRNGAGILCRVDVFPLEVERQRKNWPEREERITRWFPIDEAADAVREPELAKLIRAFIDQPKSERDELVPVNLT
jgi:8-oxo-dGTP pyrophosphatase MutT (NUDIX family)